MLNIKIKGLILMIVAIIISSENAKIVEYIKRYDNTVECNPDKY